MKTKRIRKERKKKRRKESGRKEREGRKGWEGGKRGRDGRRKKKKLMSFELIPLAIVMIACTGEKNIVIKWSIKMPGNFSVA